MEATFPSMSTSSDSPLRHRDGTSSTATFLVLVFLWFSAIHFVCVMFDLRAGQFVVSEYLSGGQLHGDEQSARMRQEDHEVS